MENLSIEQILFQIQELEKKGYKPNKLFNTNTPKEELIFELDRLQTLEKKDPKNWGQNFWKLMDEIGFGHVDKKEKQEHIKYLQKLFMNDNYKK